MRTTTIYNGAPAFTFTDRSGIGRYSFDSIIGSLPIFAKLNGLKSVKDIKYERLILKMKYGSTMQDQNTLVDQMYQELDSEVRGSI